MCSSHAMRSDTLPIIALDQCRCHILWCDTSRHLANARRTYPLLSALANDHSPRSRQ
jgi:hypothetical protein